MTISSLKMSNFKNFKDETLRVGPFTVIAGANGSGKSNIRDAFRVLHGIGRGYSLADILGGKYGPGGEVVWHPICGTFNEIVRFGESSFSLEVSFGELIPDFGTFDNYSLTVGTDEIEHTEFLVKRESLRDTSVAQKAIETLAGMRFLDLSPEHMRNPSFAGQTLLGDGGENLPTVLKAVWGDAHLQQTLRDWLRELTPMDVVDFDFPSDSTSGRVQLVIIEADGRRVSGYAASDGTLRFLAMLVALLGPQRPGLYFFEEIDNGIHPSRLHLLVELIEEQTSGGDVQVITTTHSPQLLAMLSDDAFNRASVVCRREDSKDAVVRLMRDLPNAVELRESQGLDRLHVSGWFEDAISFTERDFLKRAGRA